MILGPGIWAGELLGGYLTDSSILALLDTLDDDEFALQLLYFATEPAFARLSRAAMEASPDQRAWLSLNAGRLMADALAPPGVGDVKHAPLRIVSDD